MNAFCEESRFILTKWNEVAEVMKAVEVCRSELAGYLVSLETVLKAETWWRPALKFVKHADDECYISRKDWADDSGAFVIWIGVYSFTAEAIFGGAEPPSCYLWLQQRAGELAEPLTARVKRDPELNRLVATGTYGVKSRYLLQKKLRRWHQEEFDEFASGAPLREIAEFMSRVYAAIQHYKLPEERRSQAG